MNSGNGGFYRLDRWLDKLISAGLLLLALTLYLRSDVRSSWRALLLIIIGLAAVHGVLRGRALWQGLAPQVPLFLSFWLAFAGFTLLTAWTGNTFPASQEQLLLNFLLPASLPWLAVFYLNRPERLQLLGWAFLGGLGINLFRNAEQYVEEWQVLGGLTNDIHLHRHFADGMVFGLPFLLAALIATRQRAGRLLLLLMLATAFGMILLTGARGAWLATGLGLLAFVLLLRDRKLHYALLGLGLVGVLAVVMLGPGEIVMAKIQQGFDTSQRTSGTWGPTLDMMADKPWLGYGFGPEVYHEAFNQRAPSEPGWSLKTSVGAHNHFLQVGFAAGIPGLMLFLLACLPPLILILRQVYQAAAATLQAGQTHAVLQQRVLGAALCCVFLSAIFTQGMFENRNWPPIAFWLGSCLAWLNLNHRLR